MKRAWALRFLLLALIAVLLAHTTPAKNAMAALLASLGGRLLGGEVAVEGLDYRLWTGEGSVHGLALRRKGVAVTVAEASVRIGPVAGLRASLKRPRVEVTLGPGAEEPGPPSRPWTALDRFAEVAVQGGELELRDAQGTPWLQLRGIEARLDGATRKPQMRMIVAEAGLGWPEGGIRVRNARANALLELEKPTEVLRLRDARISVGSSWLAATGELAQLGPVVSLLTTKVSAESDLIRQLFPELAAEGRVEASLALQNNAAGATGTFAAETPGLSVLAVGPWTGSLRGRVEGQRVVLDTVDLRGYGGAVAGQGTISLATSPSRLDLRAQGIDVAALAASLSGERPPVASLADATLRLDLQGPSLDTIAGQGSLVFRPAPTPGWPVAGSARVTLSKAGLAFEAERLEVREAQISMAGSLSLDQDLDLTYSLDLPRLEGVKALGADAGISAPDLALAGAVLARGSVGGRLPDWHATAELSASALSVEGVDLGLAGILRASSTAITIDSLQLKGPDGIIDLSGTAPFDTNGGWNLRGEARELRITEALARRGVPVATTVTGEFAVGGKGADPSATFRIAARAEGVGTRSPATLSASGTAARRGVRLEQLAGQLGGGTIEGSGSYSPAGRALDARLHMADVRLEQLPWLPEPIADAVGTLTGDVEASGPLLSPRGRFGIVLADLSHRGQALPSVAIEAVADGSTATLTARAGEAPFLKGLLPFRDPWLLHAEVALDALPLTDVLRSWPALAEVDATLTTRGQAVLDLPVRDPRSARYDLRCDALDLKLARPWRAGPFRVHGDLRTAEIEDLELRAGESRLAAEGGLGLEASAPNPLHLRAQLLLAELPPLAGVTALEGRAELDLHMSGRLAEPDLTGTLQVHEGRGRRGAVAFDSLDIDAGFRSGILEVGKAQARLLGGEARATGRLPLRAADAGERPSLEFTLSGLDLASLLPRESAEGSVRAPLELSGRVSASRLALEDVSAEGQLIRLGFAAGAQELSLETAVDWRLERGRISHSPFRLRGPSGGIDVEASLDLLASPAQARLRAAGDMDLAGLNPLLAGTAVLGGRTDFDLTVEQGTAGLRMTGQARLKGGSLTLEEPPIAIADLEGNVRAGGDTVEFLDFRGRVGDGRLHAGGRLRFTDSGLSPDVAFRAERLPLEYPEGLRTRSSGELRLAGETGAFRLEGDIRVHTALYTRQTDASSQALDRLGAELEALDAQGSRAQKVQLGIRVRLEDGLRVDNGQADLVVDGALDVGGDLASPETRGSLTVRDGGTVRLSRALLRLTDGRAELTGYPRRPPELNVHGRTQVTGIAIDVSFTGPLDEVQMALSSPQRSDLTQGDLATLLLTGRTASAAADAGGAIVAEELAAAFGQALDRRLGGAVLIDVSRDESLIVEDTNPSQRFNIGVPVTKNLYVVYSQALDRGDRRWILDFRPREHFRLRLIDDEDGSAATEVSHRFGLNLWSRKTRVGTPKERPPRVREVSFEGWPDETTAALRARAEIKPGSSFDHFGAEEAAHRLEHDLRGRGHLAAVVEVREREAAPGEVDVAFRALPGPRIHLAWLGEDPGKQLRERVQDGFVAYLPVEDTASRLARAGRHLLQAEGHSLATVAAATRREGGDVQVALDVRRGPKSRDVDLQFEGNASVPAAVLAAALPDRDREEFFALLDDDAEARLAAAIRLPYAERGFLEARVARPRTSFDSASLTWTVAVPVDEGPRARIVTLALPEEARTADAPGPGLALREGEPFRLDAYVADRARLVSWYRNQGYPEARVAGMLEPVEGGVVVRFTATPGPRPRVHEVRLAREGKTRERVVESALTVKPGDLVRPTELAESRERLSDTRVFRSVDVRTEPAGSGGGARDVVVDLVERNDLDVEYSVRYTTAGTGQVGSSHSSTTSGGLQFGGALEAANPFGWAHRYRLYGLLGSERILYGLSFDAASFFGRRLRTQVFLFDDDDRELEIPKLAQHIRGATFQQTKRWPSVLDGGRWHDRRRMQWGYTYKQIDYTDLTRMASLSGHRAGPIHSLVGDTRDSFTDPHRGVFWSLGTELALRALGSDVDYVKLYGQFFAYVPLGSKVVWAQGLRLGVVPGDDPLLLLESRFRAGGATTVRGFEESDLGPKTAGGEPLGGQALLVFNQELRFPIWDRLHGGIFYDAGNVFALASELALGSLRHSAGAGLRLMFPFGAVRVDWGHLLDAKQGEQRSGWVFTIGHAF